MIEDQIKKLTIAIDALTAVLLAQQSQVAVSLQPPKPTAPQATTEPATAPTAEQPVAITRESLQAWALVQVRQDKAFKVRLVNAIGKYKAKTISQLPDDATALAVYKELGGVV